MKSVGERGYPRFNRASGNVKTIRGTPGSQALAFYYSSLYIAYSVSCLISVTPHESQSCYVSFCITMRATLGYQTLYITRFCPPLHPESGRLNKISVSRPVLQGYWFPTPFYFK